VDQSSRFQNWFQIISNVAIIIGLGLVIYELNQSKALAHAQLIDSRITNLVSIYAARMGEDPRAAVAKAECGAGELNETDAVALDAMYRSVTLSWFNMWRTTNIGGFDANPEPVIRAQAREFFTSAPGRAWLSAWASRRQDFGPIKRIVEIATEAIKDEAGEALNCEMLLEAE
jgi:hypothetical protein